MKESLQITLRKNRRSEDLIQIARKSKGQNILHSYSQSSEAIPEEQPLSETECFEIEWFDQMVKFFLEKTGHDATELERYRLFLPESLYQAMFQLYEICKEHDIDYRPMDSMLKSIVNKIRATEKKLFEKTGIELDVLSETNYREQPDETEQLTEHAAKIFKALVEQPDYYERFNEQALNVYHKSHNIKPGHFKGYAKGHTLPSKWIFACAIDVISSEIAPNALIDENALFDLWVKPGLRAGKAASEIEAQLQEWQCSQGFIENIRQKAATF